MLGNIVTIYDGADQVLARLERNTNSKMSAQMRGMFPPEMLERLPMDPDHWYYNEASVGSPIVFPDAVAKPWLHANYTAATHFYPGGLPGTGEVGADIKEREDETYFTAELILFAAVQRALHSFRRVETDYRGWVDNAEGVIGAYNTVYEKLADLDDGHELKGFFDEVKMVGKHSHTPTGEFYSAVEELHSRTSGLNELNNAVGDLRRRLETLRTYDFDTVEAAFEEIRSGHRGTPSVYDGMVYMNTPAASGGICAHTHPGHFDPLDSIVSSSDMDILMAQSGIDLITGDATGMSFHSGAGETQGVTYVMHIPRKHFFAEVQAEVDAAGDKILEAVATSDGLVEAFGKVMKLVHPIKEAVLARRLDDIMRDEILGFQFRYASVEKDARELVVSPVITESEYARHEAALSARGLTPERLDLTSFVATMAGQVVDLKAGPSS